MLSLSSSSAAMRYGTVRYDACPESKYSNERLSSAVCSYETTFVDVRFLRRRANDL